LLAGTDFRVAGLDCIVLFSSGLTLTGDTTTHNSGGQMMKGIRILFVIILTLMAAFSANAQTSGVHSEYMKDSKTTRVETSMLYIYDMPDQFIEVMFRAWYTGEKLAAPVKQMELDIYSFSKRPLYASRAVSLIADGVETKIGTPHAEVLRGQTNNGADSFYVVDGNPNVGIQVPVPPTAQIKGGGNLNGKTLEWMTLGLKPDQVLKLLTAKKLEIRVQRSR
jgi:hypothetical protein